ncbi:hypothetical protein M405DRAFT_384494 [Rhizopogon salebrosus TDB-379]|nr:hypothetical protein M405DRAFT_384494 [Rhizopogon salebrosus TDB-379]
MNPSFRPKTQVKDDGTDDLGMVDLEFDLEAEERMTHYGLREMVAKLYWPEESRETEPDILKKVQMIAEEHPEEVGRYIPERKTLGIDEHERGSRVFYSSCSESLCRSRRRVARIS